MSPIESASVLVANMIETCGMSPIERAAHVTMRLVLGEELTARQIARQYGVSCKTAYSLLGRTSRVVPIYSERGIWRLSELCPLK